MKTGNVTEPAIKNDSLCTIESIKNNNYVNIFSKFSFVYVYRWKLTAQKKARATYPQYDVTTSSSKLAAGVALTTQEQDVTLSQDMTSSQEVTNSGCLKPSVAIIKF